MSPAGSADPQPARAHFAAELTELHLQTEMMGVLVDQNLERARAVLATGDLVTADRALAADDGIDAMNVSLTEQCYEVLRRQGPVAADLRLVVSVVRVTAAFERVGDLCLRIAKLAPEHELLASNPVSFDILVTMADLAVDHFRDGLRAWASDDLALAARVAKRPPEIDLDMEKLTEDLIGLSGPDAARLALRSLVVGHSLQRISDHASVLGRRVQYLITGEHRYLAAEVR
jgi:phosphate transport system protein